MDLLSRLDLFSIGRDYVRSKAKRIDPTLVDVEGSDVNIFVGSASVMAAAIIRQLGYAISRLLLDSAEKEDLDRYALDRYGISRKAAAAALGSVLFSRPTAAAGGGAVPIGTVLKTLTGIEYVTITQATFAPADLGAVADVRAVQAGKDTQVGANYIRQFVSPSSIFDPTITVTNPAATAGGENVEDDDVFRERIRDFWRTARRGILAAIEFGALTVPGVTSAQAIEELTSGAEPARVVNLYISDSSGVASAALGTAVRAALEDYRAGGIAVIISTSIPLIVNISLRLKFQANVDTTALAEDIRASVMEFVNGLPVNGTLYTAQLYSMLQRFTDDGLIPDEGTILAPVGDLIPSPGQTIRTLLENITLSIG